MPTPETLRTICDTMNISWAEAFAIAGFFGELLEALADLASLGAAWAKNDGAMNLSDFRSLGIIRFGEQNPLETLQADPALQPRYVVGSWQEVEMETVISSTDASGRALSEDEMQMLESLARSPRHPSIVIVPKPTAAALLVATAGFPRRGDIYRDGASSYAANVLASITAMIASAQAAARYRRKLPPMLASARTVLADKSIPFELRRPVAAEYVVAWADSVCQPFTHYGRLAAFEFFGETGSSLSTMSPYIQLPQIRMATLPDLEVFKE